MVHGYTGHVHALIHWYREALLGLVRCGAGVHGRALIGKPGACADVARRPIMRNRLERMREHK
jgi:hypothetical protein